MRNVPKKPRSLVAALLAVAVHIALALFLIFGVQWQNKYSEPMMVEVVPPAPRAQTTPAPQPVVNPPPEPPPPVTPPPVVPPVVPRPPPPPVKAEPRPVTRPEPAKVDIALKARQEKERAEKERLEKQKREQDRLALEQREREQRDIAKKEAEKRERELREANKREADRRSLEELKLAQDRARQEADERQRREEQTRREREQREQLVARETAAKAAAAKAQSDYVNRIKAKIRGNVIMPPDITGNPEAIFDVIQLPTGEIISAEIRKSSGLPIYDDAVYRAILKSSPLPKPDTQDLFQRSLKLTFRPKE